VNRERRKKIKNIIKTLSSCQTDLEFVKDDEDEARENTPENLQNSDSYAESETSSDTLSDAITDIEGVIENLKKI